MRYHQDVNFHIKEIVYIYIGYAIRWRTPIIGHHMNSSFEFNHRTSINHAYVYFLYDYSWEFGCGIQSKSLDHSSMDMAFGWQTEIVYKIPKEIEKKALCKRRVIYWEC
jgi:hypothetical protein